MTDAQAKPALSGQKITLQPRSGDLVQFPVEIIPMILTLKNMMEDLGGATDVAIPIAAECIKASHLDKISKWCIHHLGETFPEDDRNTPILQWDKDFLNIPKVELFDILLAANHLDIKPLLNLICKDIAHSVHGKSEEEMREMYKIPV